MTARHRVSVRERLRNYSWRCYRVGWKCRRIVPIGTDRDDPSQLWRMVSIRIRLSVRERHRKYSLRCYGVGCEMSADRPDRDGSWRPATAVTDGVNSRPFVCPRETWNIFIAVLWSRMEMSADRPDRDGSWRPVTAVTDGVDSCPFVCSRETFKIFMMVCTFHVMEFGIGSKLTGVSSHAWSSKSSLTKNQRPYKLALGWITDFSSVAKLFVWNVWNFLHKNLFWKRGDSNTEVEGESAYEPSGSSGHSALILAANHSKSDVSTFSE